MSRSSSRNSSGVSVFGRPAINIGDVTTKPIGILKKKTESTLSLTFKVELQVYPTCSLDVQDFENDDRIPFTAQDTFNTSRVVENIEMTLNDNNDESGICSCGLLKADLDSTSLIINERDSTEDMCCVDHICGNHSLKNTKYSSLASELNHERSLTVDESKQRYQQFQSESVLERNSGNISSKIQPQRHIPDTKRLQFLENAGAIKCWFLQGSLLINVILVFACLFFFLQIKLNPRNDIQHKEAQSFTLCVMDNHNHPMCTNHSMYLQYLLHITAIKENATKSSITAQSMISFAKPIEASGNHRSQETVLEMKESKRNVISNSSVIDFADNQVVIGISQRVFVYVQVVLKKESRRNNATQNNNYTVFIMKGDSTNSHKSILMKKIVPSLKGSLTLQTVNLMGMFILQGGDRLSLTVSHPELVYSSKECNMVTLLHIE